MTDTVLYVSDSEVILTMTSAQGLPGIQGEPGDIGVDGDPGPPGPPGDIDFHGAFDAGFQYAVNDVVFYQGSSWHMHTLAAIGTLPTDAAAWELVAQKGDTGNDGADGADGADGSVWRSGVGAPSNVLGADNDYYLNTANGDVYGKAAGAYTLQGNIKGVAGTDGTDGADGADGDTGTAGSVWRSGAGAPSDALGVNTDHYLNTTNGDVYLKAAGTYSVTGNIKGAPGSAADTDVVTEGATNKYFTEARVRAAVLTGLSLISGAAITATDSVLTAFGKLQKQITDALTSLATHVADTANPHSVTKAQVGLSNCDNTSDASKPVSTAQQTALDLKATLAANTFSGAQIYADQTLSRGMMKDMGEVWVDKGNSGTSTQTLDYSAGSHQQITATGNHTIATSNWPPTGNTGYLQLDLVNGGAFSITWPTINWEKPDGTFTTSIATYLAANGTRTALQTSGTDMFLLWSHDGGTTIYGKLL